MSIKPFNAILPAVGLHVPVGAGMLTQGQAWFVRPYNGSDGNNGKKPDRAFKTLAKALDVATANQNDVVYMLQEHNTSTYTTDYQTAMLDWNKNGVHLIGVNAGHSMSQRSRLAWASTASTAVTDPLFKLSASNCYIANLEFYSGLASATSLPGAVWVSGTRNRIHNCHIAGIGHDDNDILRAYSLRVTGSELHFTNCHIGLDTIARGGTAVNSEIMFDTSASQVKFIDCEVVAWIEHATQHPYVYYYGATAVGRWILFKGCVFLNFSTSYGYTQAVAMLHSATPTSGVTWVHQCSAMATNWSAAGVYTYISNSAINTAYTGGTGYAS